MAFGPTSCPEGHCDSLRPFDRQLEQLRVASGNHSHSEPVGCWLSTPVTGMTLRVGEADGDVVADASARG